MIRLTEWCDRNDVSYTTAWRWRKNGRFPKPIRQIKGIVYVLEEDDEQIVEVDGEDGNTRLSTLCPKCGERVSVGVDLQ